MIIYEEKTITKAQFDSAVKQVMDNMVNDPKLEGMSKILIPMTGAIFAKDMSEILFGEESEDNK